MPVFANTFWSVSNKLAFAMTWSFCGGAKIARPDNAAPFRKGGHRETGQHGTILYRSQRVEHPFAQEKN